MPTISIFFGIMVQMYWKDHPPAHIHVFYQGFEALTAIDTGEVIGGRLPPKVVRLVRGWMLSWQSERRKNWHRAHQNLPFEPIPGADVE